MSPEDSNGIIIRHLTPQITTFTTQFNRFAPLGYRKFIAVGNRATAIKLSSGKVLLVNSIQLTPSILRKLDALGGVHYIACDLGHHMYIKDYLDAWPHAKAIGVKGMEGKRKDVKWDFIYDADIKGARPETFFGFTDDIESILFEGHITRAIAWYHKPSKTLIQSNLLINLPCTEQYKPSSSLQGLGSYLFSMAAQPHSPFLRGLFFYMATTDYVLMRRDAKKVAEWDVERIVPCHGDVIDEGAGEAWRSAYAWFLEGPVEPGLLRSAWDMHMKLVRWFVLL